MNVNLILSACVLKHRVEERERKRVSECSRSLVKTLAFSQPLLQSASLLPFPSFLLATLESCRERRRLTRGPLTPASLSSLLSLSFPFLLPFSPPSLSC